MEDLCYRLDMDGLEDCALHIDCGRAVKPAELSDEQWDELKKCAAGATEFVSLMETYREKFNIGEC